MIEQNAVVRDCEGDVALVEVRRAAACGSCAAGPGCGTAHVAEYFGRRTARVTARNPIGARPGESVVVGYEERAFLRAAVIAYLLPIAALVLAAAAGTAVGGGESWGVLAGAAGLAGGLVVSRQAAGRLGGRAGAALVILRHAPGGAPTISTSPGVRRDQCDGERPT